MLVVFMVMALIFIALISLIVWAATNNRQATMMGGPTYIQPGVVIVEEPPIVDAMIAADLAADVAAGIAFGAAEGSMMHNQGGMFDNGNNFGGGNDFGGGDSGFGGNDFLGGDSGFDSSGGGFDSGGGGDF
jgi:hypothetical protein